MQIKFKITSHPKIYLARTGIKRMCYDHKRSYLLIHAQLNSKISRFISISSYNQYELPINEAFFHIEISIPKLKNVN